LKRLYFHFKAKSLSVTGFQVKHRAMAPKKASKKNEDQPEGDIISDTTASGVHSVKSWTGISEKLEDELKYAATDSKITSEILPSLSFIRLLHVRDLCHIPI
jgi:hypothetical protein